MATRRNLTAPKLSRSSIRILKTLWDGIRRHCDPEETFQTTEIHSLSKYVTPSAYNHIPQEIREEFERTEQKGFECHVKLPGGRTANIYMLESATSRHPPLQTELYRVIAWLRFVSTIAAPHCAKDLHIHVLATDAKKVLPRNIETPIDQIHANTAFTTSCAPTNEIFVFRREEWFKVLLHETFHCMGLDFSADWNATEISNSHILSAFPAIDPRTDVRLYETFCEMWAELFYIAFSAFSKNGSMTRFSETKYREVLFREQRFSIYQSNKLLRRAGFTVDELSHKTASKPLYRENTQSLSYYILKSALLWNVDGFLQWCSENAKPMQFDLPRIKSYCLLVEHSVKSPNYVNASRRRVSMGFKHIRHTMRMTSPPHNEHT